MILLGTHKNLGNIPTYNTITHPYPSFTGDLGLGEILGEKTSSIDLCLGPEKKGSTTVLCVNFQKRVQVTTPESLKVKRVYHPSGEHVREKRWSQPSSRLGNNSQYTTEKSIYSYCRRSSTPRITLSACNPNTCRSFSYSTN